MKKSRTRIGIVVKPILTRVACNVAPRDVETSEVEKIVDVVLLGVARLETVSATKTVFCVILDAMGKYQTKNV